MFDGSTADALKTFLEEKRKSTKMLKVHHNY